MVFLVVEPLEFIESEEVVVEVDLDFMEVGKQCSLFVVDFAFDRHDIPPQKFAVVVAGEVESYSSVHHGHFTNH